MAWNEPGNSNNNDNDKDKNRDQDPWGKPPKNNGGNDGPPDLDEALRKVKESFNKFLGGKKTSNNNSGRNNGGGDFAIPILPIILIIIVVIIGFWLSKAIYVVDQQEEAVILRFGKYHDTVKPGLHIYFPPIDTKFQVNVTAERSYSKHGQMLTSDENIVEIPLTVQYRIIDLEKFVLKNDAPEQSLENATDSALRQVAGSTNMDDILTSGREKMAGDIQEELTKMLEKYETGIQVTQVNIQSATAPSDVQSAFDDVIRAREEQQKLKNEAETYQNGIVPDARGEAARIEKQATGYREAIADRATGEAIRFEKLLAAYQQSPKVTRERMYLETIQEILTKTSKILVTGKDGQSQLLYLPIDKLMNNQPAIPTNNSTANSNFSTGINSYNPPMDTSSQRPTSTDLRTRGNR
ncbi:FtsH protease activity modulator HflK [Entomomonas asaccharolytica]|uniref:Protein HflK n=1 Tax=Entomomonas asaccharolytica TaxID=2785331 RepID=A0A974RX75_9GAMM|nr:FtsH protease activity modulator HflK [Entomomonas asaccharolytica]QQP85910.1 FtsH protease activity modulator HflK [Entomomonas asaccharolytica]